MRIVFFPTATPEEVVGDAAAAATVTVGAGMGVVEKDPASTGGTVDAKVANIVFSSHEIGDFVFLAKGCYQLPSIMEPKTVQTALGKCKTSAISFTNPLTEPIIVTVSLGGAVVDAVETSVAGARQQHIRQKSRNEGEEDSNVDGPMTADFDVGKQSTNARSPLGSAGCTKPVAKSKKVVSPRRSVTPTASLHVQA
ncbi:hypothetical protein HK102_010683, partial [Quaeritorhiza haematococci]